jgi:hypothetical protein
LEPEHAGQAHRHIGITGKIVVELKAVAQNRNPGGSAVERIPSLHRGIAGIRIDRETVRNDDFLEQSDHENADTHREIRRHVPSLRRTDLRHDLGVVRDRTGDQLRKEGDEEGIVEQCEVAHQAAVGIHEKGNFLKRDE